METAWYPALRDREAGRPLQALKKSGQQVVIPWMVQEELRSAEPRHDFRILTFNEPMFPRRMLACTVVRHQANDVAPQPQANRGPFFLTQSEHSLQKTDSWNFRTSSAKFRMSLHGIPLAQSL